MASNTIKISRKAAECQGCKRRQLLTRFKYCLDCDARFKSDPLGFVQQTAANALTALSEEIQAAREKVDFC